jgi:thiamine-phosphate pyrophosphorylase
MTLRPGRPRWPERVVMLVTDRKRCGRRPLVEAVAEAIEGGVNIVQLREKDLPGAELLQLARQLRGICGQRALFLVNDRVDVALLAGADGVHLPENGLPVAACRQLLPASMTVGRSVHSVNAARQAELDGADYLVAGTLFPSPSHRDVTPAGVELLRNITARVNLPVIAIGGINPENVDACWQAGAAGIAVVSTVLGAEDPQRAAARLAPPREELGEPPGCV